jgi:hypothetical protein
MTFGKSVYTSVANYPSVNFKSVEKCGLVSYVIIMTMICLTACSNRAGQFQTLQQLLGPLGRDNNIACDGLTSKLATVIRASFASAVITSLHA